MVSRLQTLSIFQQERKLEAENLVILDDKLSIMYKFVQFSLYTVASSLSEICVVLRGSRTALSSVSQVAVELTSALICRCLKAVDGEHILWSSKLVPDQ